MVVLMVAGGVLLQATLTRYPSRTMGLSFEFRERNENSIFHPLAAVRPAVPIRSPPCSLPLMLNASPASFQLLSLSLSLLKPFGRMARTLLHYCHRPPKDEPFNVDKRDRNATESGRFPSFHFIPISRGIKINRKSYGGSDSRDPFGFQVQTNLDHGSANWFPRCGDFSHIFSSFSFRHKTVVKRW
uniref:Putative secreted protein n=1 Tax=Anopheles darlingi TaxID=43151 RepID=A0A2M4DDZ1_ANODA